MTTTPDDPQTEPQTEPQIVPSGDPAPLEVPDPETPDAAPASDPF